VRGRFGSGFAAAFTGATAAGRLVLL
jgi:hypothetical protein